MSTGAAESYTDCISAEKDSLNECPEYDTKQSDGVASIMLDIWGMPLLPGPLQPGVVTPDRVLSMGQIKVFDI